VTRGCTICQRGPAKKSVCCGQRLCDEHAESAKAHRCPRAAELLAADPKRWRAANEPEQQLATALVERLNLVPGVHVTAIDSGGARQRNGQRPEPGMSDIIGWAAPEGIFIGVETKNTHKDSCSCDSCAVQRAWGARLVAAGGVYVAGIRSVQAGVDGVRFALARRRSVAEPERAIP
jgi:hypothetical protein